MGRRPAQSLRIKPVTVYLTELEHQQLKELASTNTASLGVMARQLMMLGLESIDVVRTTIRKDTTTGE